MTERKPAIDYETPPPRRGLSWRARVRWVATAIMVSILLIVTPHITDSRYDLAALTTVALIFYLVVMLVTFVSRWF